MYEKWDSHHQNFLLLSDVRWLSRGKILERGIELKSNIELFLREKKHAFTGCFEDVAWVAIIGWSEKSFSNEKPGLLK